MRMDTAMIALLIVVDVRIIMDAKAVVMDIIFMRTDIVIGVLLIVVDVRIIMDVQNVPQDII